MFKKDDISLIFNTQDQDLANKQQQTRTRAKKLTSKKILNQINGMLPLVVDGTGRHYPKIEQQYKSLTNIGYDAYMIFVNTTLQVAQSRNENRERKLNPKFVEEAWHNVQDNIGKFQDLFGSENFIIVDNSRKLDEKEIRDLEIKLTRQARKFINEPLKNAIGKLVIRKLKESGGKYISDISDTLTQNKERFAL
jgi:predicted kinase